MPHARILNIYLQPPLREAAMAGRVGIVNRIGRAVARHGLALAIHPDTPEEIADPERRHGWSLFHMQEPVGPRCLCLRRAYHYPFWRIEATNQRWWFDVAQARFDPQTVDPAAADRFVTRWRRRIVGAREAASQGFIFMPLQGKLREHRSFQAMSPLAMIQATLEADPRPIRATLHPWEPYDAADLGALEDLAGRHPRFSFTRADPLPLLAACDLVVTQNSSVALTGFFLDRPAVLFGGVDFWHPAGSVPRQGVARAFAHAREARPDFAAYLWWFFRLNAINATAHDAEERILERLAQHHWHF